MHVTVFGASAPVPGEPEYEVGTTLGRHLARAGHVVVTGGYGGIMEAVSRGARQEGGHTIGVTTPPAFPHRSGANPWVVEEIQTPDITDRIRTLLSLADAAVALPGSIGTFTEIVVTWGANEVATQTGASPVPLLAVGDGWNRLLPDLVSVLGVEATSIEWTADPLRAVQWLAELA